MSLSSLLALQLTAWGPLAIKIMLAAILGGIIGLERLMTRHPAGLRTNMLIAVASCLFTTLSIEGFPVKGAAQDTARVAAQIVSGVGFLGAGAVLRTSGSVQGLTTAATIWLVAAIGMSVGTGSYFLAIFTTFLAATVLIVLSPISKRVQKGMRDRRRRQKAAKAAQEEAAKETLNEQTPDQEE